MVSWWSGQATTFSLQDVTVGVRATIVSHKVSKRMTIVFFVLVRWPDHKSRWLSINIVYPGLKEGGRATIVGGLN